MTRMRVLADSAAVGQLIDTLAAATAKDIAAAGAGPRWAIVGIRSRGDLIARRLAQQIDHAAIENRVGTLDITLYRDDLSEIGPRPVVGVTDIPFGIDGLHVVLVDDVLMTGRSIRAALASLMDLGRPRRVWLSVLVDRGGRELPIAPDHVGLDLVSAQAGLALAEDEVVEVQLMPMDPTDAIVVRQRSERRGGRR